MKLLWLLILVLLAHALVTEFRYHKQKEFEASATGLLIKITAKLFDP